MSSFTLFISIIVITQMSEVEGRQNYAMYVWTNGFDGSVPGCNVQAFLDWNEKGPCFTHVWNTQAKRDWLWATCNVPGREIDTIFVSGFHHILKNAYDAKNCGSSDITMVKHLLTEGHSKVMNLKIYGLFAVSDKAVSEQYLVKYIVYYNDHCAANPSERLDGVATNNEYYSHFKCGDMAERLQYLNDLKAITTEAAKQIHGKLLTHYSMSWHWGLCNGSPSLMSWSGKTSDVNHHMIDIFDSTDVQVGYILSSVIADRMKTAGYDYARNLSKPIFTTVYLNKVEPCQITFFPDDSCRINGHTETGMYAVFDDFHANGIDYARPCIHYFRGTYSAGVHPDWPKHSASNAPNVIGKRCRTKN